MLALRITKPGIFDVPIQFYDHAKEDRKVSF